MIILWNESVQLPQEMDGSTAQYFFKKDTRSIEYKELSILIINNM